MNRKEFLGKTTLAAAGMALMPAWSEQTENQNSRSMKNVRLETGFEYDENGQVIATRTDLFNINIENGKIVGISPNQADPNAKDMKGWLMLPSFKDMHIHLDKTRYGEKWQANIRPGGGIKGMIKLEQEILPKLLENSVEKAGLMIDLLQSKGTGFARSHVNIEPTSGLKSLTNLQKALENRNFGTELVSFPQHGIFYTHSSGLMRDAAQMGIDFIGGLDPATVDGDIERSIDFIVQLALEFDKGIDIHLHETAPSGLETVEYLIKKVNENPALKHKTYLSHCFILGVLEDKKQDEIIEKLSDAAIGINSTIPFGRLIMPIPKLLKSGVKVMVGNDSIVDHWSTFGTGSVLYKVNLAAQLYGYSSEFALSRALKIATVDHLPLDDQGNQQWPKPGDAADLVFFDASCSAETVARMPEVESLMHQGDWVF